jgi:branched-chain amino acid transport system ATP-binding protein
LSLLEVENLSKRFGGLVAVNNVSFHVDGGDVLGIIGPNGAGKTTLFNLITGFIKPDSGTIKFKGEDITGLEAFKIVNKGIARTFQIVRPFFHLSVIDNVLLSCASPRVRKQSKKTGNPEEISKKLLEAVGLSEKMYEMSGNLPHGDLKRLEIARALATMPDLLLLDEPFSGLNPTEVASLTESIEELLQEGLTMIIIEHNLEALMKIIKRAIVLHFGQKIAEGIPEEIVKDRTVQEVYMGE